MSAWQIINTIIGYVWLFLVLALLYRHAVGGSAHVHRLRMELSDISRKSVESAHRAVEIAERAMKLLEERLRNEP